MQTQLGIAILQSLVNALFVFAIALVFVRLLRRASASVRRLVLVVAIAVSAVLPLVAMLAPHTAAAGLARLAPHSTRIIAETLSNVGPLAADGADSLAAAHVGGARSARALADFGAWYRESWTMVMLGTWLAGALLCLARLVTGVALAARLVRRSTALGDGTRESAEVDGPRVAGVLRPVVLVPPSARAWSSSLRRAVLAHEGSHVRRRDGLALACAEIACAIYWMNPLAWYLLAALRRECELAADEDAIATGIRPTTYATHLLALASILPPHRSGRAKAQLTGGGPAQSMAMAPPRSELAHRIETLVDRRELPRPATRRHWVVAALGALAALTAACATASPRGAVAPPVVATHELSSSTTHPEYDARMQSIVDAEAIHLRVDQDAKRAVIAVVDVNTGATLAYTDDLPGHSIEPASALKPLVVALALESGAIKRDERFDCGHGERDYGTEVMHDANTYGQLDVTRIIAVSSNVGLTRIFDRLGDKALDDGMKTFHIDMPADIHSGGLDAATTVLGLGVRVSPLVLARAYAAIGNGGVLTTQAADGTLTRSRVLRAETADAVRAMLEEAVHGKDATGRAAQIARVHVGGKTGTADLGDTTGLGEGHERFATFVGLVPAAAPRWAIYVGVATQKDGTGGTIAAPVFARLATRALE